MKCGGCDIIRFLFQALCQQLYRGTHYEAMIHNLQLDTPHGVLPNLAISMVFYLAASFGSYLGLRYLHKEKR